MKCKCGQEIDFKTMSNNTKSFKCPKCHTKYFDNRDSEDFVRVQGQLVRKQPKFKAKKKDRRRQNSIKGD